MMIQCWYMHKHNYLPNPTFILTYLLPTCQPTYISTDHISIHSSVYPFAISLSACCLFRPSAWLRPSAFPCADQSQHELTLGPIYLLASHAGGSPVWSQTIRQTIKDTEAEIHRVRHIGRHTGRRTYADGAKQSKSAWSQLREDAVPASGNIIASSCKGHEGLSTRIHNAPQS